MPMVEPGRKGLLRFDNLCPEKDVVWKSINFNRNMGKIFVYLRTKQDILRLLSANVVHAFRKRFLTLYICNIIWNGGSLII